MLQIPNPDQFLCGDFSIRTLNKYTLVPMAKKSTEDFYLSLGYKRIWFPFFLEVVDTKEKAEKHVTRAIDECKKGKRFPFIICDEEYQIVGAISLTDIDRMKKIAKIGWIVVNPIHQGKGIATGAGAALIEWAFQVGFLRLEADVAEDNLASRKCFEKLGFRVKTIHPKLKECSDGVNRKMLLYVKENSILDRSL